MNSTITEMRFNLSKGEPSDVFGVENFHLQCDHINGNQFTVYFDKVIFTRFNTAKRIFDCCLEERCKPHWLPILNVFCQEHHIKPMFAQMLHLPRHDRTSLVSLNRIVSQDHVTMQEKRAAILYILTHINPEVMFYTFDQKIPSEMAFAKMLHNQMIPIVTFRGDQNNNNLVADLAGKSIGFFNYCTFA